MSIGGRVAIGVSLGLLLIVAGLSQWPAWKDARDWAPVERAARRLESGIKYEPVIVARSKLADLDAAVAEYKARRTRSSVDPRVDHLEKSLEFLAQSFEDWSSRKIYQNDWAIYRVNELLEHELIRECDSNGKLYVEAGALRLGYLRAGRRHLARALGETPLLPEKGFNVEAGVRSCQARKSASDAAQRAAEKESDLKFQRHLASVPLCVRVKGRTWTGTFVFVVDGVERPQKAIDAGAVEHIDAAREVVISGWDWGSIEIWVNGSLWGEAPGDDRPRTVTLRASDFRRDLKK